MKSFHDKCIDVNKEERAEIDKEFNLELAEEKRVKDARHKKEEEEFQERFRKKQQEEKEKEEKKNNAGKGKGETTSKNPLKKLTSKTDINIGSSKKSGSKIGKAPIDLSKSH